MVALRLRVHGEIQDFIPLEAFRETHDLPSHFSIAAFGEKDTTDLGSIDGASDALKGVRAATVAAVPATVDAIEWTSHVTPLTEAFEAALRAANDTVGLREPEIVFAVDGFEGVCSAWALALTRAALTGSPAPIFEDTYTAWLLDSVRLGSIEPPYHHRGEQWNVRIVHHAYGRVGLQVTTSTGTHYIADKSLACPAEGFMFGTLRAVGTAMQAATR